MDRYSLEDQVSLGWLFLEGFGDSCRGAQFFRQRPGNVGERIPGPTGDKKLALFEKGFGLMPLGDIAKCIDADQKEKIVTLLQGPLQAANGIDGVVRGCSRRGVRPGLFLFWCFQQRW